MSDDVLTEMKPAARGLAPFSLHDAPSIIERVFPAQKVGAEAQTERKSGAGQTLTALGSYWKGRKPLVLIRACVLASLLPATDDPDGDLELFEALMRMDEEGLTRRGLKISPRQAAACRGLSDDVKARHLVVEGDPACPRSVRWNRFEPTASASRAQIDAERLVFTSEREAMQRAVRRELTFLQQVMASKPVEKIERLQDAKDPLYEGVFDRTAARLGTAATALPQLIDELGAARFGRRPTVGDPFAGGGSIPFEAARIGCDVVASDLNPIAMMLTWGALNVIGGGEDAGKILTAAQAAATAAVEQEIVRLGIEHNLRGDRAKAYLYCLETVDPRTGWRVPIAPSWIISRNRRCVAKPIPILAEKRFDIVVAENASDEEMAEAEVGTLQDKHLVYHLVVKPEAEPEEHRIAIARLRGDGEGPERPGGGRGNRLRMWAKTDVAPREPEWDPGSSPVLPGSLAGAWKGGDIWLERLYCIQWMDGADIAAGKFRPRSYFAAPGDEDRAKEEEVRRLVEENIAAWQNMGFVPDMPIEAGKSTSQPIWERGWTHWNHLFGARHLLIAKLYAEMTQSPASRILFTSLLDQCSRLCRWAVGFQGAPGTAPSADQAKSVFYNHALNTNYVYAARSAASLADFAAFDSETFGITGMAALVTCGAADVPHTADIWIYDPPYADAVHYHEITEFFIAWLRKNPPGPFKQWTWDSRRPLAIQGKGEKFRSDMVDAFRAMANHMPDNGLQVCMFTHQDAGVWADMAGIVWGAGLRVTAAWYVSTETNSDLKKGGYVQGTVLLVLRKRRGDERAYKDELVLEVRGAVQRQVDLLTGLNQRAKALQRDENPFSDADLQMAGYAAALEVLTGYTHIEGVDMTREALRPRVKGQTGVVEEMIDLAVQTATELMRPEGIEGGMWERLAPTERFWLKMAEAEAGRVAGKPEGKLDDYQNFAKAYRADGWDDLMADKTPNRARLKGAADFKRSLMSGHPFAGGIVRPILYAVNELRMAAEKEEDPAASGERAIAGLRENLSAWAQQRQRATVVADWLGNMLERHRPGEASAARTLAALIRSERLT